MKNADRDVAVLALAAVAAQVYDIPIELALERANDVLLVGMPLRPWQEYLEMVREPIVITEPMTE